MYHAKGGINMLKIENTQVYGWEAAIRGMRNPKNSWDKSDSILYDNSYLGCDDCPKRYEDCSTLLSAPKLGEADLKLMKTLAHAGTDHGKFLRMINVTMDITAPLYWWKEFDTYKVGTVTNSCSTMHKIQDKEFTLDDFSIEHLAEYVIENPFNEVIDCLNFFRGLYLQYNNKNYWWQMIQLLPSSYNQKRTIQLNYAVLKNMYFARRNHKLDEWHTFCDTISTFPYFKEICIDLDKED